jgi:putative acetyltransferase
MLIRRATVDDAEQIMALDRVLARDGRGMVLAPDQVGPIDSIRRRIEDVARAIAGGSAALGVVAAEDDGQVVGAADLKHLAPIRCNHVGILSVGVHPDWQRRGIGRALMGHLVEHARTFGLKRLELYVRADNAPAQGLYRSLGFEHEGTRARFIRLDDGTFIDDWIFVRFL